MAFISFMSYYISRQFDVIRDMFYSRMWKRNRSVSWLGTLSQTRRWIRQIPNREVSFSDIWKQVSEADQSTASRSSEESAKSRCVQPAAQEFDIIMLSFIQTHYYNIWLLKFSIEFQIRKSE